MIMLIDTMAERYGMLPSEIMQRANTFDVFVTDTAIGYRNYITDKQNGKNTAYNPGDYNQDDLMSILKETRGES